MDLVRLKMEEKSMTQEEVALLYNSEVKGYSKLFMVVLLPLLALSTFLSKRRSMPECGKHFILATHNFSFVVFDCFLQWGEKLWKAGLRSLLIFTFLLIIVFLFTAHQL